MLWHYRIIFFVTIVVFSEAQHRFGYSAHNQRRWARSGFIHCGGDNQSPIAIQTSKAIQLHMPAVDMIGYRNLLNYPLKFTNNGHTVAINIPKYSAKEKKNGDFLPYIRGAKLPGEFEIESVHFHWGDVNNRGSEHILNDMQFAMEMHMVHRNKLYGTVSEAIKHPDGLAVLGFFFMIDEEENDALHPITRHLQQIVQPNSQIELNVTFSLNSIINSVDMDTFYTYRGSLTTPPCSEAVTWVIYPHPIPISQKQLSRFREVQDDKEDGLVDNFRHLQPIGNRRIFLRHDNMKRTLNLVLSSAVDYRKWNWFR